MSDERLEMNDERQLMVVSRFEDVSVELSIDEAERRRAVFAAWMMRFID
ncbi:MAG: hypothetical protein ACREQ4_01100 [Candidatus Binataceae bacterium]